MCHSSAALVVVLTPRFAVVVACLQDHSATGIMYCVFLSTLSVAFGPGPLDTNLGMHIREEIEERAADGTVLKGRIIGYFKGAAPQEYIARVGPLLC